MTPNELLGKYRRLVREWETARRRAPTGLGHIARLERDIADVARAILPAPAVDEPTAALCPAPVA